MKKIKLICTVFAILFICCLFAKPVSAETVATNRRGSKVYFGGYGRYIDCFNTKTGKISHLKTVYKHVPPESMMYHRGYFYCYNARGHLIKLSKKGKLKKTYAFGFSVIYKNYIYHTDGKSIWRSNLNGTGNKRIIKNHAFSYMTVLKNKLYYVRHTSKKTYLYSASLSGKKVKKICQLKSPSWGWCDYITNKGSMYLVRSDGIYQYYPGWKTVRNVIPIEDAEITGIAGFHKEQIWFEMYENGSTYLCKATPNGDTYEKVKEIGGGYYTVVGSGDYCMFGRNDQYYSMRLDGEIVRRIKPKGGL